MPFLLFFFLCFFSYWNWSNKKLEVFFILLPVEEPEIEQKNQRNKKKENWELRNTRKEAENRMRKYKAGSKMRDKKNRGQSKEILRTKASKCEEEIWCVYVIVTRVLRSASPFPNPRRIFNPYYFIDDAIAFVIHKLLLIPLRDDDFRNWWFSSLVRLFFHCKWKNDIKINIYDF